MIPAVLAALTVLAITPLFAPGRRRPRRPCCRPLSSTTWSLADCALSRSIAGSNPGRGYLFQRYSGCGALGGSTSLFDWRRSCERDHGRSTAVGPECPGPAAFSVGDEMGMASDRNWTTQLGNAFLAQQQDVMDAVQRLRGQAQEYGYLRSNGSVVVSGGPYIAITPGEPWISLRSLV